MKTQAILFNLLLLTMIAKSSLAQTAIPRDTSTGLIAYQGVVKDDSVAKEELYARAKSWILKTLKSSDNMVQLDDKDFNSITGSGTILLDKKSSGPYSYQNGKLNFKLTVQFKDGRLRYTFENFTYWGEVFALMQSTPMKTVNSGLEELTLPGNGKKSVMDNVDEKMKALVLSFTNAVSKANAAQKDDW
ncbi:MAG: DUF4468 domain-containing protein [Bacteroidota bacterium]